MDNIFRRRGGWPISVFTGGPEAFQVAAPDRPVAIRSGNKSGVQATEGMPSFRQRVRVGRRPVARPASLSANKQMAPNAAWCVHYSADVHTRPIERRGTPVIMLVSATEMGLGAEGDVEGELRGPDKNHGPTGNSEGCPAPGEKTSRDESEQSHRRGRLRRARCANTGRPYRTPHPRADCAY